MPAQEGVYVDLSELVSYEALARQIAVSFPRVTSNLLQGNRPSRVNGRGGAFDQIRPYFHGDDVRDIDWNVTARMGGAPFVRMYHEERQRPLLLLVDQTKDMFFGTRTQLKSVLAARLAALLLWMAHHRKQPYGLVIVEEDRVVSCPPRHHKGHLIHAFTCLARANQALSADRQQTRAVERLPQGLRRLLALITRDTLAVLVSDFHNLREDAWHLIGEVAMKTQTLAIPVYDGIMDNWPQRGQFLATYGAIEAELTFPSTPRRQGVEGRARQNLAALQDRLAKAGVGATPFSTYLPAHEQLCKALNIAGGSP
ncbi:DUF58 domain-containing protein [Achromobacter sp. Root83]|uniref:DUF58 domain-containing protein n=1 Tax=Achromobacter sp. Root83 TaxID=1736602 RepID=UPI000AB6FBF8|nr:DUF58 domain-containing protein [Achromobacter sp. Root83]